MLKLETGERDSAAQSWLYDASSIASGNSIGLEPKLRAGWARWGEVLKDYKSLEVFNDRLKRFEKIIII